MHPFTQAEKSLGETPGQASMQDLRTASGHLPAIRLNFDTNPIGNIFEKSGILGSSIPGFFGQTSEKYSKFGKIL